LVLLLLCVKEEIVAYKIVEEGNEEKTKLNFFLLQKSPQSLRLFLIMMSVMASKTKAILLVSVAQVK